MKQMSIVLVLLVSSLIMAATEADINAIRQSAERTHSEVTASEQAQINEFWESSLNTMLLSDNAQDVVTIRRQLEDQMGREPLSFYTTAYINAAKQALQNALGTIERIEDEKKQQMLEQNLMVLTANLKNPALADIALDHLNDKDPVVRYWAVKAVTNAGIVQSLTSDVTADEETKKRILTALKDRVAFEQQVEIKALIIHFATSLNDPIAHEILLELAEQRIEAYKNWSIDTAYTNMDTRLLIAMGNIAMASQDGEVKSTFARKFSELYALVFQLYINWRQTLSENQLEHVISVILEVDRTILAKMLNVPQTGILMAIRRNIGLEREYETIFGDQLRAGDLATMYKFDYGKDDADRPITEPPAIGEPPSMTDESEE